MFRRNKGPAENKLVAGHMRGFFRNHSMGSQPHTEERCVGNYAAYLWDHRSHELKDAKRFTRGHHYVGLCTDATEMDDLTKRATLVSDTLLLSHEGGQFVRASTLVMQDYSAIEPPSSVGGAIAYGTVGFVCPSPGRLSRWIHASEPLLKAGLAWYLPNYRTVTDGTQRRSEAYERANGRHFDYLVRDRRLIDASGAHPIKGRLVRPILEIDLPFIDGTDLRGFSEITIGEFDSYQKFREYLRQSFLAIDDGLNAVQSEQALQKVASEIRGHVYEMRGQMKTVARRRAVTVTGASLGVVSASLAAVYGPALEEVIKILGLSGGIWGAIEANSANSPRKLREDSWYYVWALHQHAHHL